VQFHNKRSMIIDFQLFCRYRREIGGPIFSCEALDMQLVGTILRSRQSRDGLGRWRRKTTGDTWGSLGVNTLYIYNHVIAWGLNETHHVADEQRIQLEVALFRFMLNFLDIGDRGFNQERRMTRVDSCDCCKS